MSKDKYIPMLKVIEKEEGKVDFKPISAIPIDFIEEKIEELKEELMQEKIMAKNEIDTDYMKGLQQQIYALDDLIHFWNNYQILKEGIDFDE